MDDPDDTTPSEGADERAGADASQPLAEEAIARAAASWRRRGYRVRYQDEFLAQLARRGAPGALPLALGLLVMVGVVAWWIMNRSWLVVSITAAPDGRLVVHRQRSRRPPPA